MFPVLNYNKLTQKLVAWLKMQLKKANAKGFVVGLSGGVDSAVVSVLCKMAAGKNVLCIVMPCNSSSQDLNDAILVAKKFDLKTKIIDLTPSYNILSKILGFNIKSKKLYAVNIKPRLRMLTLYYFANKYNYLVAGTGNKSELTMGYFTKYGDGGVDILPIGNLLKTQVWELAKYLGIPEKIIQKPPSAGLWLGQTDEKEMGIKYADLDEVILSLEKNKKIKNKKYAEEIKFEIKKHNHKLNLPPIFYF